MSPALGYLIDDPLAVASQTSTAHWPMELLMAGVVVGAPSAEYTCPDIPPDALDQDGLGACVAFAACTIWDAFEHQDWGSWLFATGNQSPPSGAFLAYDWLKHGSPDGSFPGDGIPDVEGSYPEAVWQLATRYGLPDKAGKVHRASAYYSHTLASTNDEIFVQGVLQALGPVNVAAGWPGNWFDEPASPEYRMPVPGTSFAGGHSYSIVGWKTYPDGLWWTCMNSWGGWGSRQGIFRVKSTWFTGSPLGPQIVWRATDIKDAPTPPPPAGGDMVNAADKTPRLLSIPVGTQFYTPTDNAPLVKLSGNAAARVFSPFKVNATQYAVVISTGGVQQLARVDAAAVSVLASSPLL